MGGKGEETREMILRKASRLFNERGYAGASLSDVMKVTGLQKGGLYNHFGSKEDLALEAFDFSVAQVNRRVKQWIEGKTTAPERLEAMIAGFVEYFEDPPVPGGCPIMNTAVESDDANPRLRERAREAMNGFLGGIKAVLKGGVKRGELRADVNIDEAALLLLTSFEGALMLSRLHRDGVYLRQTARFLRRYVSELKAV